MSLVGEIVNRLPCRKEFVLEAGKVISMYSPPVAMRTLFLLRNELQKASPKSKSIRR